MGIVEYAARELLSQLDKLTQEFYEFVMPAIDIYEDGHELVIEIELPGLRKDDINIRIIDRNILSIKATRKLTAEEQEPLSRIYLRQRPLRIDKKILLPISTNEVERVTGAAKYTDGVVTLRIPLPEARTVPIT
ncbi:MAG TPA: archaeal heat shock protein Hsp14 [Nitrososphaera sp.]|jgi:HSP20 family protein|nr:archaeal heat shock protein Hsp14 [Nitrososphaera sp.]